MEKKQITVIDIAKALDLSPSTISRALNNNPAISKETRDRVKQFAQEHKYKPNTLARRLRTNYSNTIGVIVPEIIHYFFSTVLAGVQEEAGKGNYNLIFCQSNEDYEQEIKSVEALLDARVCGVIASQSKNTTHFDHFQEIIDNNIHLVFYDRICTGINTDKVVADDYAGALNAVNYLIERGCTKIAYLGAAYSLPIANNRRMGYEDALRKHKIPVDKNLIKICDTVDLARSIIPEMLKSGQTDAFFCVNDDVAAYCVQVAKSFGFRIPEDISICGFTNAYIAEVTDPPLTTVDQHGFEMGKVAARLLINRIEGREQKSGVISRLIKTDLIVRESTR